jgi:mannan polymerase II complex MNN11 subunit
MNPSIPLHTNFLSPASLLALPLRDVPVFPPETSIRTLPLRTQPISQISLILSHGGGILHTGSILVRRGDFANFFIDSWNDPLVRSYGFPGEDHQALEHMIQWHSTVLDGLAVMPKRSLLSFGVAAGDDEQYHEGDFVVHLDGYTPHINN